MRKKRIEWNNVRLVEVWNYSEMCRGRPPKPPRARGSPPNDFVSRVASQVVESLTRKHYRIVGKVWIGQNEVLLAESEARHERKVNLVQSLGLIFGRRGCVLRR